MKPVILRKHKPQDRVQLIEDINNLTLEKDFIFSWKERKPKRSISQNNLYWLWLGFIEDETGNDAKYLHEDYFGKMFLPKEKKVIFGVEIEKNVSTTSLDTGEFKKYLDKIQLHMAEKGIKLPDPDDYHFREFYETYKEFIR